MRLPPLHPAVAATRLAVRRALRDAKARRPDDRALVLVALSGGADSLALAAALAFEAPRAGLAPGAVVIDHGLQAGSAAVASRAGEQARGLGLDPVRVRRVTVAVEGEGGLEAAAREARYTALERERLDLGATLLLTAHTRDDQSEQVLLALARGSGTRALSGIPAARGPIRRPFLGLTRADTEAACAAQELDPWRDPHNANPRFARVRARALLPLIDAELGPGFPESLARTAELAREDADALDAIATAAYEAGARESAVLEPENSAETDPAIGAPEAGSRLLVALPVVVLAEQPPAIRNRMLRLAANRAFGASLSRERTLAVAALVERWHGQGPIQAPGGAVRRDGGEIRFEPRPTPRASQ